jgi:dipeptidyl aminopeptidase/acylaminoacyl peptidase
VLPEDVYELVWVADARITPDGHAAAVAVRQVDREQNAYRSAIWLVPLDGSEARRLTSGQKLDMEPRISPDGTRLAFVSDRESKARQLYVLPLAGGEASKLTDLEEDVTEVAWSPDGSRLTFSSRVREPEYAEKDERRRPPRRFKRLQYKLDNVGWIGDRRRHVFVVAADGSGDAKQLTFGDFEDQYPAWSRDGRRIAFASAREDDWDIQLIRDLYLVDADGGEPVRLTGGDAWYEAPSFSPDGSRVACRVRLGGWDYPKHGQIAVVDVSTGGRRILTESLDRNCMPYPEIREPVWDGDSILFCIEDRGNDPLYRVSPDGVGAPEPMVDGELRVTMYDAAAGEVIHAATTATVPAELFAGNRRLTEFTRDFCDGRPLGEPERFTARSSDGSEVEAWVVRPPDFQEGRRYPVLLTIHGGPYTQYGNGFFDEVQVYARAGYVVLFSNPRGSSGYGEEWGRAIRGPDDGGSGWGSVDYEDLMAVVDEALRRFDFCDAERLGVLGGSYGGYMTSWIVGHTKRFRAALSERAVNNLISEFGSSDLGWFSRAYTGVWPFEDLQPFIEQSPTTNATNITTPLLILHSEQDLRCNIEQGEHLFSILRILGREVEMVRFPAESHELTRSGAPVHRVQRFQIVLDWFARHL